jgi:GNAT superfamily N-acetyltransferase
MVDALRGAAAILLDVTVRIEEESIDRLGEHATVPIAFLVERVLEVSPVDGGLGGIALTERHLETPWVKDYDAIEGEGPTRWGRHFDVANWGLLAAHDGEGRVGGAVVAFGTPGVDMLEGRSDLAVLWDIRVRPEVRSAGAGTMLMRAVETWARDRGCRSLKVETQNINVPACRMYRRVGYTIRAIDRRAYKDLPDEVQLIWVKDI